MKKQVDDVKFVRHSQLLVDCFLGSSVIQYLVVHKPFWLLCIRCLQSILPPYLFGSLDRDVASLR